MWVTEGEGKEEQRRNTTVKQRLLMAYDEKA